MPKNDASKTMNNSDIVYGYLLKLTRPIITTKSQLLALLKFHRGLELTESQIRTIFDKLKLELKIATSQEGVMTKISILSDYDEMVFSHPLPLYSHRTTPEKAFLVQKYLRLNCVGYINRISMKELAKRFASRGQTVPTSEREIREIIKMTNNDVYVKRDNTPFERVIMSNSSPFNVGGYWLVATETEADEVIERSRAKAMSNWSDYWHIVNKIKRQNQYRIRGSETQQAVFKAISDDLKANPIMDEINNVKREKKSIPKDNTKEIYYYEDGTQIPF
jgi:hypothetical protein